MTIRRGEDAADRMVNSYGQRCLLIGKNGFAAVNARRLDHLLTIEAPGPSELVFAPSANNQPAVLPVARPPLVFGFSGAYYKTRGRNAVPAAAVRL